MDSYDFAIILGYLAPLLAILLTGLAILIV